LLVHLKLQRLVGKLAMLLLLLVVVMMMLMGLVVVQWPRQRGA
jgi:hypothetical protein